MSNSNSNSNSTGTNMTTSHTLTASKTNLLANNITVMRPSLSNLANWYGVKLDSGGFVISLTLRSNRLRGQIPPSIGRLTRLEYLDLNNNRICGSIPSSLAACVRLKDLYLTDNMELNVPSRAELQALIPKCKLRI